MIKPLTSLRFFFALMVFFSHTERFTKNDELLQVVFKKFLYEGYLGVSFFFILSGFIISYSNKDKLINKEVNYKGFWIARIARIYPLHLLTFLLSIPLTIGQLQADAVNWLAMALSNIFLLQSFIPVMEYYFSFNAPAWSISNEMFFYMLFPFIITCSRKDILITTSMLMLLVLISLRFSPKDLIHPLFYINPFFRLVDFSIGILIFDLFKSGYFNILFRTSLRATFVEIFALSLFILFFSLHEVIPQSFRFSCYYWLPTAIIILSFAYQEGAISYLLSNNLLIFFGKISFSFYLIHSLVIRYTAVINAKLALIENDYFLVLLVFLISIVASYLAHKLVEKPATIFIRNRFMKTS